ncbi:MAG: hypothetical protein L3J33_12825 [Rhodobacteraceae bacterium]|nr:hypothetical protein [Paracoccaceae bacterium]
MALSDYEIEWVEYISGKEITQTTLEKDTGRSQDKMDFLKNVVGDQLSNVRQEIEDAQKLIVTRTKDAGILTAAWRKLTNSSAESTSDMKWRAEDSDTNKGILSNYEMRADVEIDTIDDIDERTKLISAEDIAALAQSFERIKELEKAMKLQFDDMGEPLFSDADIRNELWTPLVRAGVIPDNMVPDDYSEQAIAFKGAQDLYAGKLGDYTATHNKTHEKWKKGLKIAKSTATVIGSVVSNSVTIGNATEVADTKADNDALSKEKLNPATSDARKAEIDTEIKANKGKLFELANVSKSIDLGTTIVTGGLSLTEMVVDHVYADKEQDNWTRWAATVQKGIAIAQSITVKSVELGIRGQSTSGGANEAVMIKGLTCGLNAAFTGVKMAPKMVLIIKEPNESKRFDLLTGIVSDLADVVANSIVSAASGISHGDTDEQKAKAAAEREQMSQIAAYLKIGIRECGNVPAIIKAYQKGDYNAIGMLLGGTACTIAFAASSDAIFNAITTETTTEEKLAMTKYEKLFVQTTDGSDTGDAKMETAEDKAINANLEKIAANMQKINLSTVASIAPPDGAKAPDLTDDELQAQISGEIEGKEKAKADKALKKLLNSAEGAQAIMEDADAVVVGFEALYADAYPDTGITDRDPEVILRATEAIDRAMANTSALRQKVALINGISGGAAGILAALVPGTGAVVAIQKVVADMYALVKCVEIHNAWVDSMEVAMAGQGGSTAAIQNILENAKIHLSQASIKLILDTLKAGSEVAKMFDPTGAAAITSASASMASAVVEYGFQMQKEIAIVAGWNAYKEARANPKNRKKARKALRLNSTLAKCCIAYGASIMGDTAAKQAIKATGLSIAALQDDKDICKRLVSYLENELVDDPVVLMVDFQKGTKWMPGTPTLNLAVWTSFKAACHKTASPALSEASLQTPAIDRLLSLLNSSDIWTRSKMFEKAKDQKATDEEQALQGIDIPDAPEKSKEAIAMIKELSASVDYLNRLNDAFGTYQPLKDGDGGQIHDEMLPVAKTFATLARASSKIAANNLAVLEQYPHIVTKKKASA